MLGLNVDATTDDEHTGQDYIFIKDPTHALYRGRFRVEKVGRKVVLVLCNGALISVPKNSTNLGYIKKGNASKLSNKSVKGLIKLATEIGVICQ